ncbi:hypothetical protein OIE62_33295 [Streptomyces scopuliridis]|uniref:Uncharacterized protein n=1 Tax=Streptomyces scopuliridis TaxID=452529 RepID=A0ACD4ZF75_9ACTN|nr:hypothetical protein [Streptomyces scopuliridis]WSB96883.1 hypothetical protein OG835_07640 [Streptomyces scopuliridis]WSC09413.1 hypothetical protein OIE62_33295 [Streptomyces scopuliridis]
MSFDVSKVRVVTVSVPKGAMSPVGPVCPVVEAFSTRLSQRMGASSIALTTE